MPSKKKKAKMVKRKISSVGSLRQSINVSKKRLKIVVGSLAAIIILLLALSKIPATQKWPIVSYVRSLTSSAATYDEYTIYKEINSYRATLGLPMLTRNTTSLYQCAKNWARYLSYNTGGITKMEALEHNDSFLDLNVTCTGGTALYFAENLGVAIPALMTATNQLSPYDPIFATWLTIPEFKANLDNKDFRQVAVGIYTDPTTNIAWVVAEFMSNFTSPSCAYATDPLIIEVPNVLEINSAMKCIR